MAYGVKYRMNLGDELNISWEIDIYLKDYVSSIIPIKGSSSFPIAIEMPGEDDPFNPVCGSNATIGIMDTALGGNTFTEFQTADVYEYYVDIKRAGTTWWKGFLITETYQEDYTSEPFGILLTFGDSLNELAFERYDDGGTLRSSMATNIQILVNCQNELPSEMRRPFREMINVFEDSMNDADTEGLLEQLYIYEPSFWELDDDDEIKGKNCLSVIRHIVFSMGCRIILSQEIWWIQRVVDMKATTALKYVDYDNAGLVTGNSTEDLRQAISARGAAMPTLLRPINNDAVNTFNREYQEIEFSYSSKNITTLNNNVIVNPFFDKGYVLENGSPQPKHYTRSSAVNTQLGVDSAGIHLIEFFVPNDSGIGQSKVNALVIENSMLVKTKVFDAPYYDSDVLTPIDATRESYSLIPASPADSTVTVKNLLTDDSDNLEIRIKGYFDYTYATAPYFAEAGMFNKWTIKLGSNYYNLSNQTWSTTATSRVLDREFSSNTDSFIDQSNGIKRHHFDKIITLANFPSDSTDDLTVTWFIPETSRASFNFQTQEKISNIDITFETMQIRYVSNDSTEFSIQKVLGETGSTTLRTKRKTVEVQHSDGPSNFSINSFRKPTTFLATTSWSTRGNAEALPHYKLLIMNPYFESFGTYRQVWNGSLRGFLEPHNTVSSLDSKVFIIKSYSFDIRAGIHNVVLHEFAALSPSIAYTPQVTLSPSTTPTDSGDGDIGSVEDDLDDTTQGNQGAGIINTTDISISTTQVIKTNNDTTETAKDYPV